MHYNWLDLWSNLPEGIADLNGYKEYSVSVRINSFSRDNYVEKGFYIGQGKNDEIMGLYFAIKKEGS